jgi:hypothetical protein
MKGDLGGLIWIVIVVLGIAGKLLDKKGPRQPPVARTGRGGQPTLRPGQSGRPGQAGQAGQVGRSGQAEQQGPVGRSGQTGQPGQAGSTGLGRPSLEVSRPMTGLPSAVQTGRLVNEADEDEGISLENVKPTVHTWQAATPQPEVAPPAAEPNVQPIPVQQAVVWSEILGKPAALRGRRK